MNHNSDIHPEGARAVALAAAERSNIREGLPPSSMFSRDLDAKLIRGEITYAQAIDALGKHYRAAVARSDTQ
ncbi:hypothetical protein [Sinimarinibacterium thermocellulolyticum]|uniref:Antitoxin VbhA domain-containing protein n=1 Tax=Sinimarinibacterium thermocellulolyticum TaxID=3170016 RepID=A0ABV2A974_9GAMM